MGLESPTRATVSPFPSGGGLIGGEGLSLNKTRAKGRMRWAFKVSSREKEV
jgi:hypothetical protein